MRRFIEINHVEHLQQFDQKKLLSELPSYLRGQVISHTHWGIVRKIRFFDNKSREFVWLMLPMLQPMKMYKKDILYSQGDPAEDIFFIIKGRVKFFYETKVSEDDRKLLKERNVQLPEPVPINLHVEGNYFGDNDVLVNQGKDGRDSTAIAETECQLLVIGKMQLADLLKKHPSVRREMKQVAAKRKQHHQKQIAKIASEFQDVLGGASDQMNVAEKKPNEPLIDKSLFAPTIQERGDGNVYEHLRVFSVQKDRVKAAKEIIRTLQTLEIPEEDYRANQNEMNALMPFTAKKGGNGMTTSRGGGGATARSRRPGAMGVSARGPRPMMSAIRQKQMSKTMGRITLQTKQSSATVVNLPIRSESKEQAPSPIRVGKTLRPVQSSIQIQVFSSNPLTP